MKAIVFSVLILFGFNLNAQVHSHAIGLRGGYSGYYGNGGEISYQLGLGEANRLELDLGSYGRKDWNNGKGWGSGAYRVVSLAGVYHWVWNITDGLNWFVGPGAQIVFYDEKNFDDHDGVYFNVGGQIGLEYDFTNLGAPLQLGLDYRPMFLFGWYGNYGHSAALSLRFLID